MRWVMSAAAVAAMIAIGGCATHPVQSHAVAPLCQAGDHAVIRDTLYFGRNRPDGGLVDDEAWQAFLDEVVTPHFPDGLTVIEASGQWRGASGVVEREHSQVVTVLHADVDRASRAVIAIADEYKRRFHQEAVLRERSTACASY